MIVTFTEERRPPKKIRFGPGGSRKNAGRFHSRHPRKKAFFMLSKYVVDQLHTLNYRTMSKFVIEALDEYNWDNIRPQYLNPILSPVSFHIRLPEHLAKVFDKLPMADKSIYLDRCLSKKFLLSNRFPSENL